MLNKSDIDMAIDRAAIMASIVLNIGAIVPATGTDIAVIASIAEATADITMATITPHPCLGFTFDNYCC